MLDALVNKVFLTGLRQGAKFGLVYSNIPEATRNRGRRTILAKQRTGPYKPLCDQDGEVLQCGYEQRHEISVEILIIRDDKFTESRSINRLPSRPLDLL